MADVFTNVVEVVTREEFERRLRRGGLGYIGFEPSGFVHIGTGLVCGNKIKDLEGAGIKMTVLLADWHAMINDKLGGDMMLIGLAAEHLIDALRAIGVGAKFVYASEIVSDPSYWEKVIRIAKVTTLKRAKRAMTIMGRREEDAELDSSKILYPFMQVADIFHLGVHVAYGGMDQRHAHMLARDVAGKLGLRKPIALHTALLSSLKGPSRMDAAQAKMSKSVRESAIFLHDPPELVEKKIMKAYCPPSEPEGNPVLDIARMILIPYYFPEFEVKTSSGTRAFYSPGELVEAYGRGEIHPLDLKEAVAKHLNEVLEPIRSYLDAHPEPVEELSSALGEGK